MSKHRKPDDLLDELSSLQSLLGDAARDIPIEDSGDEIPVLPPEDSPEEGDSANQIPLLEPAAAGSQDRQVRLRKEALSRANPFLSPGRSTTTPATDNLEKEIASRKTPSASHTAQPRQETPRPAESTTTTPTGPTPALDDATLRALVDEVLAQWLPRIERELRNRLMDELRSRND